MTKEEIIQAIKAEIEGLKGICTAQIKANPGQAFSFVMEMTGYDKVLSFLSTLESEKPIIPDLEKELARFYLKDLCGSEKDEISEATLHHNFPIMWDDLRDLAHHFAQWGYLRATEKYNEIEYNRQRAEESVPNDLEEAAKEYFENSENSWEVRDVFKAGAKWQKEQMLSKPVEGEVKDFRFVREINYASANIEFNSIPKLKEGDKVHIIVCKKED